MTARMRAALSAAVDALRSEGVAFALVHESALVGWGIDNNVFLEYVDVLVLDEGDFRKFGVSAPASIGMFADATLDGVPARLWSRRSLGLSGPFDVTSCARYGCEALAPELVLGKLPYSPDARMLVEQRARLASIVFSGTLTDEELMLAARYIRGD